MTPIGWSGANGQGSRLHCAGHRPSLRLLTPCSPTSFTDRFLVVSLQQAQGSEL